MWPWIKRWRDWAMHDLWPLYRIGPQPQALHYSYEKAGLTVHDQPIPWNAEAVLVEATLRLPASRPAAKPTSSCACRATNRSPPSNCAALETDDRYRLLFRLAAARRDRSPPNCCAATTSSASRAAVPQPGEFLAESAPADADAVRAPRRRDRRLPDVRLHPVPRTARQRGADQPDQSGAAARPGSASRVPLRARRDGLPVPVPCAARSWPAGRRS